MAKGGNIHYHILKTLGVHHIVKLIQYFDSSEFFQVTIGLPSGEVMFL